MSRNAFENQDDPQEEIPLFETTQRELADNEVDGVLDGMTDLDIDHAMRVEFGKGASEPEQHIAKLKQEGLYATARFFERALERKNRRTT